MGELVTAIDQQNMMGGAVYGHEHLDGRNNELALVRDLYKLYGDLPNPDFLMHVWVGMVYEYNSSLTTALEQMLDPRPQPAPVVWMRKNALIPANDEASGW